VSDRWPSQPGREPPLNGTAAPPLQGQPTSPSGSSWPSALGHQPAAGDPARPWGVDPTPPGPAELPPPPGGNRPRWWLWTAAVALVAILSSLATWVVVHDDGETTDVAAAESADDPTPSPSTTAPPAPGGGPVPSTGTTVPPVSQAEVEAEVAELQAFVEQQRGQRFVEPVDVVLLDDAAFEAELASLIEAEAESLAELDNVLTAAGLLDPDVDLLEAQLALATQGVLGYYEREADELVVRGSELTPFVRQTLVHELTHALDDQIFEVYRPQYEELPDETSTGFVSVLEGNARRVEGAWVDSLSEAEQDERATEEARFSLTVDLSAIPDYVLETTYSAYEDGLVLVDRLVETGGQAAVDAAIEAPPTTTEQVLDPEKFLAGEGRVDVPAPPAAGEVIDEGVFGVLALRILLEQGVTPSTAFAATDGWAGDWFTAWDTVDGATCIAADIQMDTPGDALELLQAFEQLTFDRPLASAEQRDPVTIRYESCTPPPSGGGGAASKS